MDSNVKIEQLKRQIVEVNVECERLRNEMVNMARSLDVKDEHIRHLERRVDQSPTRAPACVEEELHCLRHETETIKQENRMLREKIGGLAHEA